MTKIYVCPKCGCSHIKVDVIIAAHQDNNGEWKLEDADSDAIRECVDNVNYEAECCNPFCGEAYDAEGHEVPRDEQYGFYGTWLKMKGYPVDTPLDKLTEADRAEFNDWNDALEYVPWKGTLGECKVLE